MDSQSHFFPSLLSSSSVAQISVTSVPPCFFIHRCLHTVLSHFFAFHDKVERHTTLVSPITAEPPWRLLIWRSKSSSPFHSLYSSSITWPWPVNIKLWIILSLRTRTFSVSITFSKKKKEVLTLALAWRGRSSPWAFTRRMGESPSRHWSKRPFQSLGRYGLGWHYAW